jgi:hypothetical protein
MGINRKLGHFYMAKIIICVVCLTLSLHLYAKQTTAPWWRLTQAYGLGDITVINHYRHSGPYALRLYANALQDLLNRNFLMETQDGEACFNQSPQTKTASNADFWCLLSISSAFFRDFQPKKAFYWQARAIEFYRQHQDAIDIVSGMKDPARIREQARITPQAVRRWPQPTISVGKWRQIPLKNGVGILHIGDKAIPAFVDTGTTSVVLAAKAVKKFGLRRYLTPLGRILVSGSDIKNLRTPYFYVKDLRFGPITIHNAYVTVYEGKVSLIGMNILHHLRKFTISNRGINATHGKATCSRMHYSRPFITVGASYPFMRVKTDLGTLGLMLDSGNHGIGEFRNTEVALAPSEILRVRQVYGKRGMKVTSMSFTVAGNSLPIRTATFYLQLMGEKLPGYFIPKMYQDPRLVGTFMFGFLQHHAVTYNFPMRKMCISRRTQ